MESRYKIIISNKNLYKEIELAPDVNEIKIGTGIDCDVRLRKELFFEKIELNFVKSDENYSVFCSDNLYLTVGDVRKLMTKKLKHGDHLDVKYQESDNSVFGITFSIDFDYEQKNYNREISIADKNQIKIGGSEDCDIMVRDNYIGNDYFIINRGRGKTVITDPGTKYGININGTRILSNTELHDYDFISLGAFSFYYKSGKLYTDAAKCSVKNLTYYDNSECDGSYKYPLFIRNPRIKTVLSNEKIQILDPPPEPSKPSGNIILKLLPAVGMLAMVILLRGTTGSSNISFVLFSAFSMGIGIMTSVFGIVDEQKKYKAEKKKRIERYNEYIKEKKAQIQKYRDKEREQLNEIYYSPEREIETVKNFSGDLFNRDFGDSDFAAVRIGTGAVEAVRAIDYKAQEKFSVTDPLATIPEKISHDYKYVEDAPIVINLKNDSAVGVVASPEMQYSFFKNMVMDLAIRQYYADLKMFLIINDGDEEKYAWVRLLPHLQNELLNSRNIACDDVSRNNIFEFLFKEFNRRVSAKVEYPHIVIFVIADRGLKKHPISRFIANAKDIGVTFVFFESNKCYLPKECNEIVELDSKDESKGTLIQTDDNSKVKNFSFSVIDDAVASKIVNKLAPVYCEEVSLEGSLTKNITLFELLNIFEADDLNLEANWANSKVYKSMAAPIGVKSKNEIVYLDLNEKHHGPHGLVAGTTGSGKSEVLQTYILSMATLFHPYEVGFVIIDFKGGGMVNQFKNLPHLIGAITNIDGREINRSLLSIKAELNKRQSLFAKYDVNHIDAYIKKYKEGKTPIPLPHLILIVDEFAELKMDQPDFMKELISAARIGRSLGVHLILATQKPSGVVDAQIWSNSKFKLCLKVQNKEDSNEVIKTPLAAEIKEPGRAYLQVGNNEIFELFQSAYSGAKISSGSSNLKKTFSIMQVSFSGKKTVVYKQKPESDASNQETQLHSLVDYIKDYCDKKGIKELPGICLPPLKDVIEYEDRGKKTGTGIMLPVGIYDDPNSQLQESFDVNISEGNIVIIGSSQSGKTGMLQVLLRGIADRYSPSEVWVYVIDFASKALSVFESLNHVGGVVLAAEDEKLKNLIRMLKKEISSRKDCFAQLGITSFNSYCEAGYSDKPQIILMIDNFVALRELYSEYDDDFLYLCREGASLGITLVVTALQSSSIGYKYLNNFVSRYCLFCNDSGEYSNLFDRCKMEPKHVPGRGLMMRDKTVFEYQTYSAFAGEREIEKVDNIKSFIREKNEQYENEFAKHIPEIPSILTHSYVVENVLDNRQKLKEYCIPISMDYENVELQFIDLTRIGAFSIIGREKSGKTNLLRVIVNSLQKHVISEPSEVYVFDNYERQLLEFQELGVVQKYTTDISEIENQLDIIENELNERKELVNLNGMEALRDRPLIMCIIKNEGFFNGSISKQAVETFKRVMKMSKMLKVCFAFEDVENIQIGYSASDTLKFIKENKNIFFMDDLSNAKFMDISVMLARQYKKPIELGDGYWITDKGIQKVKTIFEE
jgi:S-DNA-T family DNA segregation ATPase FtsK/SpoIIIE